LSLDRRDQRSRQPRHDTCHSPHAENHPGEMQSGVRCPR
jgi:hypothetical protein